MEKYLEINIFKEKIKTFDKCEFMEAYLAVPRNPAESRAF
jgi:hypothetical protein